MKRTVSHLFFSLLAVLALSQEIDLNQLHGLNFRSIGPAGMSGRITSIDVVLSNTSIIYAGSSAGGLWKSVNAGTDFQPIFDAQKVHSIGDVSVYQKNPSILYVGTGEGNPRNSQSFGNGMYKSMDAGKTWTHLGLDATRNIHKVIIHPDNPDVVWVGAQGAAWGSNSDRGVYKTTDGGQNWEKILYTNESTGVADMVIDPNNPNKLLVAMWEFGRKAWTMNSGGAGSAIHMTMDGGKTWQKLGAANGLPNETLGRIGLAIAPSNPDVIYANIEAKENAMFRSNNGGLSWRKTTNKGVGDRPFYYNDVEVDPTNENRVYHIATTLSRSEDGGNSFRPMLDFFGGVHSDHHALWINPNNPAHMLDGNDGGLYSSYDMGKNWRFHYNIPVGQFYHINVDQDIPYNVYGGMQDNGSWVGPAYKFEMFGKIANQDYKSVGFGDGFDVIPDPSNSRFGYSMYQGGEFQYYDRETGIVNNIKPRHPDGVHLRFNWNAALALDPFDSNIVYGGSQFVMKSTNKGNNWTAISPDLTTNDPEKQKQYESGGLTIDNSTAENHTSILVIEPSSLEQGVMWVGTDDGNVQITRDGGESWKNVVQNIKDVPANTWVTQIKHSLHNEGEAFVVFDDHRRNNWTPYVYRTKNYGKSWERLVDDTDVWGYALSFVQDAVEPNLMFVGTEFGVYVSLNGGESWKRWKADFPTASAMDMVIHPREHDLVVGTFGRSIFVLDDIRPLRELAGDASIVEKDLHLFDIPHAYQAVVGFPSFFGGASESFSGQNRPMGALISYYAKAASKKDSVRIEISDAEGKVVKEMRTTARPGVNRTTWDLKSEGGKLPGPPDMFTSFLLGGVEVFYGTYTVKIQIGDQSMSKTLEIRKDPKTPVTEDQLKANIARKSEFVQGTKKLIEMYQGIEGVMSGLKNIEPFIKGDDALKAQADSLKTKAESLKYKMVPKPQKGLLGDGNDLRSRFISAASYFFTVMVEPNGNAELLMGQIEEEMKATEATIEAFHKDEVAPFKEKVNASDVLNWE